MGSSKDTPSFARAEPSGKELESAKTIKEAKLLCFHMMDPSCSGWPTALHGYRRRGLQFLLP
jgi:hypothetical protein